MKRFLLDIVIFLVLALTIAFIGDIVVSHGLRKSTIRKYTVWNDIYNGNNLDNDLVFVGSSSCMVSFSPKIIDSIAGISTYNLAINGHSWHPYQPMRYDTYVRYARKPKYVVIVLDNSTFDVDSQPLEREQFFPYFCIDDSLIEVVSETKKITFLDKHCPMWRYIGYREDIESGVACAFGKKNLGDDGAYKGYIGYDKPFDRASLNIFDSITLKVYPHVVDSLIRFIKLRQLDGQEVILVNRPEYYELQERTTNRAQMAALYDSIAEITGVKLIDYWNHPITKDSTLFYNSTHPNIYGSKIISVQLGHDLDSLGVNGQLSDR